MRIKSKLKLQKKELVTSNTDSNSQKRNYEISCKKGFQIKLHESTRLDSVRQWHRCSTKFLFCYCSMLTNGIHTVRVYKNMSKKVTVSHRETVLLLLHTDTSNVLSQVQPFYIMYEALLLL